MASNRIFLIEHCRGLFCCRLRVPRDNLIVPVNTLLSYPQVEFRVPEEAKILGAVDLEIRAAWTGEQADVPDHLAKHWNPAPLVDDTELGQALRAARTKLDLSLRQVSAMSRRVAHLLGDERYFVSQSSLSSYETRNIPPRHFHKAVTVCIAYGLEFHALLRLLGINPEQTGDNAMPDYLVSRVCPHETVDSTSESTKETRTGFLGGLLRELGDVPFFLRNSLAEISGLAEVGLDDIYWVGTERIPLHPHLANALIVVVNRRKRKPTYFTSRPPWQQPLYVVLKRDAEYLCAACGIENGTLVVHPYTPQYYGPTQIRYQQDAEVVGQIVAIARKFL